jgi:aminodeoxyfutalosine synthase
MTETEMTTLIDQAASREGISDIAGRVFAGKRLSHEDGVRLFGVRDVNLLGILANHVRERLHGNVTYFVRNQHLNHTNICVLKCKFCAFAKTKKQPEGYAYPLDVVVEKIRATLDEPIREIHIVGGLHPDLPWSYYLNLLRRIREVRPDVDIKAYTAVEIDYFAEKFGMSVETVLAELKAAGLDSMPGGGAEIFAPRARKLICDYKLTAEGWLSIVKTAHRMEIPTNCTLLYGHVETPEERVDHLVRLREAQDETGGFLCFIPLAFHPENTLLPHISPATGYDDLRTIAISRLMLDNIPHIKAYWIMLGQHIAQIAQRFGADDIDGTVVEEKIYHDAGAKTPQALTRRELLKLIADAGREPVERDALYNIVDGSPVEA